MAALQLPQTGADHGAVEHTIQLQEVQEILRLQHQVKAIMAAQAYHLVRILGVAGVAGLQPLVVMLQQAHLQIMLVALELHPVLAVHR